MKKTELTAVSGIQIENTLSMALKSKKRSNSILCWLVITFAGVIGSIFTFLTMFQPEYRLSALLAVIFISYGIFSFMALHPRQYLTAKVGLVLLYVFLAYLYRYQFYDGFVNLMNEICKVIYHTDWNYFSVTSEFSAAESTTVFLSLASVVIVYSLCYAVLRYQNFFLCMLASFSYVELGLYFGVAPNHLIASILFAFWCSMAAVHLSNFGSYHGSQKSSFLRKDNTFFPVSGMRFMVTEKIGMFVLCFVTVLCLLLELVLQCSGYVRSDWIKSLRANAKDFKESMTLPDFGDTFDIIRNRTNDDAKQTESIELGIIDAKMFDNVPISELVFSELPESRIYLKFDTGHTYENNCWQSLDSDVYENKLFASFEEADFYPQNFLYANYEQFTNETITVTVPDTSKVLSQCVPYGHAPNKKIRYLRDYGYTAYAETYTIFRNSDFEGILAEYDGDYLPPDIELNDGTDGTVLTLSEQWMTAFMLESDGYEAFVYDHYLEIPDTAAMDAIYEEYAYLLEDYDGTDAAAADTILLLQNLRAAMCSDVTYTLSPGKTPGDEDFAAYFLLENKQGYCEHYATAGTLLARMAGIPARYCQGYMINCTQQDGITRQEDGSYSVDVLDSYAHAWTEIYISGIGWIPFEFTFSYFNETPSIVQESTEPTTNPVATEPPVAPSLPETTNSIAAQGIQTETEIETVALGNTSEYSPVNLTIVLVIAGICLFVVLLIAGAVLLQRYMQRQRERQFRQPDRDAAARYSYRYLCRLMRQCGVDLQLTSVNQLAENAKRSCAPYLKQNRIEDAVYIGGKLRFSPHPITEKELEILTNTAQELADGIYQDAAVWKRLKLRFLQHLI